MGSKALDFWTTDCETDPFESDEQSVDRRECPTCRALAGRPCVNKKNEIGTHASRRRIPKPFIWGLYNGRLEEYYEFDTSKELLDFLRDKKVTVYAHNGGKFDYHHIRDDINTGESISIIAGRIAKFRVGECEFRDSMNILPVPLAQFEKTKIDYAIMEPGVRDLPNNRETIKKYLRHDCVDLWTLIAEHRKENGVVLTQASASMRMWAKKSKEKPPKQKIARFNQYKPHFYGGKVQCYQSGAKKENFVLLDINSAYPDAMCKPHPFSVEAARQSTLPRHESKYHHCLIRLRGVAKGCFPYRMENGDLYYPDDERTIREYEITGYEFMEALKQNAIKNVEILTVFYFEHVISFVNYIMEYWDKRANAKQVGNKALDIIYKLLMNSLYGKFASDYDKYRDYMIAWYEDILEWKQRGFVQDANWGNGRWLLSRPIAEDKHRYYNIATAASITGYVRARLFAASRAVSGPIYCDTDSMACRDPGNLELGNGLGQWKVEGKFDHWAIVGKKTYSFHKLGMPYDETRNELRQYLNYKCASKGVDLTPSQISEAASGKVIEYSPLVPTYSAKRDQPRYVNRAVRITARDISRV